ncbi:MAG TPA: AAA family ATPase [Candidatus Limnocylindrales bacterium]|nr:AAA family ATPase [Candidatus Limnocylindrales bacterium]
MILTRIQIAGFGTLRGTDLRFGRGMNLVVGPNEAGKSTLQEAILTALFGFASDRLRSRAAISELSERWRPWQEGAFAVTLEVEMEDRTRLLIERDFDAETVRVKEASSGDDVTARFDGESPTGPAVGRHLLGVTRDIYSNTACISRSEVLRLEDAGAIKDVITALADSAQPDRTAKAVLDRLREERARRIGRPRAKTGPLRDLETRLGELERQLQAARAARAAVEDLAVKRETVAALTDAELSVVKTLEAAVLAARLEEARLRLERARQLDAVIGEEEEKQRAHARFAAFPLDRHGAVLELRSHLRATEEARSDFVSRAAQVTEQVAELEAERARLAAQAQEQERLARGVDELSLKEEPLVRELVSSLTFADAQAPEVHLRAHACAEEVRRIAERHPGMISESLDWPARQVEFQRALAEWRERHNAALDARKRAGQALPPRLEQLKQDIARYREVPDVIRAGQQAEETMRREEAMAERARGRQGVFLAAMLGGLLLTALAILVAFLAFYGGLPMWVAGIAFFLLGMGVLAAVIGIWVRSSAIKEVDRRLRLKDEARLRRREVLSPWGVRSSAELQQALVEHLQKVRSDATRLELDRQALEQDERGQTAGRALRELVSSWGLPQPAPSEEATAETARLIEVLAQDTVLWKAASQRAQEAARAEAALDERREQMRQRLHSVLDRLGFDRKEALAAGRDFLQAAEAARTAQQLQTRIEQLDAQLDQLRQPSLRAAAEQARAQDYLRQLQAIYEPAGIHEQDPEVSARSWDDAVAHAQAYHQAAPRLEELRRQAGDQGGESAALAPLVADLEEQAAAAAHGLDPTRIAEYRQLPLAELERQRDQHRSTKERAQEERARAEELLNDRLMQIGDVAALEEEIATTRERLEHLEAEAHAYDLAIETLEVAARSVRRAIVPRLKSQLQAQLSPITNGRYRDVQVEDDLALAVKTQDQRTFKDVDTLSLGTRSLIYLLERVALARIISGNAEPMPLLLDEALVHADRRRLRAALDELTRLGQEHQIILFSKDEALADRGEKAGNWTIIRLPGPALVSVEGAGAGPNGPHRADEPEPETAVRSEG